MTPSQINKNNPTTTRLSSAASSRILPVAIMVCGNIAFPQLFHLIPGGGPTWLPIYFFTLVSAWCYGWRAGIVTAILSPVANSLLFGMPAAEVLPAILMKSVLLAAAASFAASRVRRASLATVAAVVLAYQSIGTLGEWAICGSFIEATCDFCIGLPGMLLQAAGGWLAIHRLSR